MFDPMFDPAVRGVEKIEYADYKRYMQQLTTNNAIWSSHIAQWSGFVIELMSYGMKLMPSAPIQQIAPIVKIGAQALGYGGMILAGLLGSMRAVFKTKAINDDENLSEDYKSAAKLEVDREVGAEMILLTIAVFVRSITASAMYSVVYTKC